VLRKKDITKEPKIALFIVPSRALVDQQAKVISHWSKLPVAKHQGGGRKTPPSEQYDVLVGTPSALLALQDRMDLIQWKNVCICVFDEVHHTKKNHPYKTLADCILLYSSEKDLQIIGLTASLVYETQQDKIQRAVANIKQNLSIKNIICLTENELRMQGHNSQTPRIDICSSLRYYMLAA
jgi:endoribonuclease Dicer